jgi:hypothetical protein
MNLAFITPDELKKQIVDAPNIPASPFGGGGQTPTPKIPVSKVSANEKTVLTD